MLIAGSVARFGSKNTFLKYFRPLCARFGVFGYFLDVCVFVVGYSTHTTAGVEVKEVVFFYFWSFLVMLFSAHNNPPGKHLYPALDPLATLLCMNKKRQG